MQTNIILGLSNIISAAIIMAISVPLIKEQVPRNRIYGIRIAKSFTSEENWYRINSYGGSQLLLWSVPILLCGIICFFIPIEGRTSEPLPVLLSTVPLVLFSSIAILRTVIYAKTLP